MLRVWGRSSITRTPSTSVEGGCRKARLGVWQWPACCSGPSVLGCLSGEGHWCRDRGQGLAWCAGEVASGSRLMCEFIVPSGMSQFCVLRGSFFWGGGGYKNIYIQAGGSQETLSAMGPLHRSLNIATTAVGGSGGISDSSIPSRCAAWNCGVCVMYD